VETQKKRSLWGYLECFLLKINSPIFGAASQKNLSKNFDEIRQ